MNCHFRSLCMLTLSLLGCMAALSPALAQQTPVSTGSTISAEASFQLTVPVLHATTLGMVGGPVDTHLLHDLELQLDDTHTGLDWGLFAGGMVAAGGLTTGAVFAFGAGIIGDIFGGDGSGYLALGFGASLAAAASLTIAIVGLARAISGQRRRRSIQNRIERLERRRATATFD